MVIVNNLKKGTVEVRCGYSDCEEAIAKSEYSGLVTPEDVYEMQVTSLRVYEENGVVRYADQTIIQKAISINISSDLNKTITDFTALPGLTYNYKIYYRFRIDGSRKTASLRGKYPVKVKYRGILIIDETGGYSVLVSPSYTVKKTYNVSYVKPYYSKYPHAIQNGNMNYYSGTFTGIFNPIDEQCRLVQDRIIDGVNYELQVMEFLANGNPKILKTYDGNLWYVMIDSEITKEKNAANLMQISFNWTEIGEVPSQLMARQGEW